MSGQLQIPASQQADRRSAREDREAREMADATGKMEWLWTWSGESFGYREGGDLWTHDGRHVGRFHAAEIYGPDGRYLGEMIDGERLIAATSRHAQRQEAFTAKASRPKLSRRRRRFWYAPPMGYADFPLPERLPLPEEPPPAEKLPWPESLL